MDAPTDLPDPSSPTPAPRPAPRPSGLVFFAIILALFAALGTAAQASNPALGLAWSELFALLVPALLAATGSNLVARRALLLDRQLTPRVLGLSVVLGCGGFFAAGAVMALTSLLVPARWVEAFDVTRVFARAGLQRTLLAVIASTLAPLCEEVAFRGWMLTAFRTRHGVVTSILATALLFALMHLDPVRFFALIALGVGYGWLAWRSGSIWSSVVAHATNNTLGVLVASSGAAAGALHEPRGSAGEIAASALLMLGLSGTALALAARAYERATPTPPDVAEIVQVRDPADGSPRFAAQRVPPPLLAVAVLGGVLLVAIVLVGHATRR